MSADGSYVKCGCENKPERMQSMFFRQMSNSTSLQLQAAIFCCISTQKSVHFLHAKASGWDCHAKNGMVAHSGMLLSHMNNLR